MRADSFATIDHAVQVIDTALPRRTIRRNRAVRLIGDQRDCGAFQPDIVEDRAQLCKVADIRRIEHRHFNTVKAGGLDCPQDGDMFFLNMPRPEQHIHPDFHLVFLPLSKNQTAPKITNRITGMTEIVLNDTSAAWTRTSCIPALPA